MINLDKYEISIITSTLWSKLIEIKEKLLVPYPEIENEDDYRITLNLYIKLMNYDMEDYKSIDQTIEKLAMSR